MDLRERVVGAIPGGISRRAAAACFEVSAASAVRWAALQRDHGKPAGKPQGGDTRLAARPGDVVILDNVPAHKSAVARGVIEAKGTRLLFLPPYSPDLQPDPR